MSKTKQRSYRRLDKAERAAIERCLDKGKSAREIARDLGRSASSVCDEVIRNRTVSKGSGKGEQVSDVPKDACPRLLSWPHVCNGCKRRRYHCSKKWKCEYSAARAQLISDSIMSESRKGVDRPEDEFGKIMDALRGDVSRGLSPAQVVAARAGEFSVSASTLYRWISLGYGGMSNMELRRKCGYKPRRHAIPAKQSGHGPERSYSAFLQLSEDERAGACEMDTVIGRSCDTQCILTLYLRPCKLQLALLLPDKTCASAASAIDVLEKAVGKEAFNAMFGAVLTDNGTEFSDPGLLEKSALPGKRARTKVYYCDVRQSQQKAGCERNHVELRKLLPKRRGISFDDLNKDDLSVLMSHLNSEPRKSLMGLNPIKMLIAAYGADGQALLDALGIEEIGYSDLLMDIKAINRARRERGEKPLT